MQLVLMRPQRKSVPKTSTAKKKYKQGLLTPKRDTYLSFTEGTLARMLLRTLQDCMPITTCSAGQRVASKSPDTASINGLRVAFTSSLPSLLRLYVVVGVRKESQQKSLRPWSSSRQLQWSHSYQDKAFIPKNTFCLRSFDDFPTTSAQLSTLSYLPFECSDGEALIDTTSIDEDDICISACAQQIVGFSAWFWGNSMLMTGGTFGYIFRSTAMMSLQLLLSVMVIQEATDELQTLMFLWQIDSGPRLFKRQLSFSILSARNTRILQATMPLIN